ncbi:hypothetical protein BZG36_01503 [Bifiguratus adelaidae]|uniref:Mitochondrial distribution and morphology protein 34 n=1 Tax=Bifiguratus adelaidae TaxID=1938954 RepID=A0A261Y4T1_9FUNG|nr:hypothetical protein BZG36_01503 [Bifiguratus adelaidae]
MAFKFTWPTFSAGFYEDARSLLETTLNKPPTPKSIVDHISVKELHMGTIAPELDILEIGELGSDKFRGIFKLVYAGDAYIVVQTKVQANPMYDGKAHTENQHSQDTTRPSILAAHQPLIVPMLLRISDLKLRGIVVLVVSQTKGITLVFKNDPLENIKVSSTFDSITAVQRFLQAEIEKQLRNLFQEDLPSMIHNLSLKWLVKEPQKSMSDRAPSEALSVVSEPQPYHRSMPPGLDSMSMPDLSRPALKRPLSMGATPSLMSESAYDPYYYDNVIPDIPDFASEAFTSPSPLSTPERQAYFNDTQSHASYASIRPPSYPTAREMQYRSFSDLYDIQKPRETLAMRGITDMYDSLLSEDDANSFTKMAQIFNDNMQSPTYATSDSGLEYGLPGLGLDVLSQDGSIRSFQTSKAPTEREKQMTEKRLVAMMKLNEDDGEVTQQHSDLFLPSGSSVQFDSFSNGMSDSRMDMPSTTTADNVNTRRIASLITSNWTISPFRSSNMEHVIVRSSPRVVLTPAHTSRLERLGSGHRKTVVGKRRVVKLNTGGTVTPTEDGNGECSRSGATSPAGLNYPYSPTPSMSDAFRSNTPHTEEAQPLVSWERKNVSPNLARWSLDRVQRSMNDSPFATPSLSEQTQRSARLGVPVVRPVPFGSIGLKAASGEKSAHQAHQAVFGAWNQPPVSEVGAPGLRRTLGMRADANMSPDEDKQAKVVEPEPNPPASLSSSSSTSTLFSAPILPKLTQLVSTNTPNLETFRRLGSLVQGLGSANLGT